MSFTDAKLPLIGQPDPNRPEATEEEIVQAIGEALDALRESRRLNPAKVDKALKLLYALHMQACGAALQKANNDIKH